MNKKLVFIFLSIFFQFSYAQPEPAQLSVWVNEAIVATYTYSYKNYLEDQKKIAKYFAADAWISYSKALNASKLPEDVQKNLYNVSAVATAPPVITNIDPTHWKATMGLIVAYQNPQYQQRQHLKVTINFMVAPSGQGVRGYTITSLQSVVTKQPCKCDVEEDSDSMPATTPASNTPAASQPNPNNAKP
ncbi:DotI/IcmL family type IV secretion protein [Legionella sp. PC997]|uniref:DotI/IcmL family type IV secretion protein n=1 Tax=Legionella sp. PC997 TaxID=2755562 RepID=UPI0015FBF628|nr:DotI/IcmL family type IV secretion protein [Legionella sp. PC997]QMT61764.1 type IV secretion protein IcmL [Legionella sp. PC997]